MTRYPFAELLIAAAIIILCAHLWLTFTVPGKAAEADPSCVTVEQDKALAESKGLEYLGPHKMPYTNELSVFYAYRGAVWVSPIKDGCVADTMYRAGEYVPERNV